jgi:enamine deaminase RidA (YjgF/YER057c/UK114 family)
MSPAKGSYAPSGTPGTWVITSGQIVLGSDDQASGSRAGDCSNCARCSLDNVDSILRSHGANRRDVIRISVIWSTGPNSMSVSEVFAEYFTEHPTHVCRSRGIGVRRGASGSRSLNTRARRGSPRGDLSSFVASRCLTTYEAHKE